jgi:hypothetical protein
MNPSSFSGMVAVLVIRTIREPDVCSKQNDMPDTDLPNNASLEREFWKEWRTICTMQQTIEGRHGLCRGALLWLIGIPLPIILLLALLFMHH